MSLLAKESLSRFYKDFQRICQKWPVDPSRQGRDFGEHMRKSFDSKFKDGNFEEEKARRTINALMKISTNYYRNKYPRLSETAFSSDNPDVYKEYMSNDFQKKARSTQSSWFKRMLTRDR